MTKSQENEIKEEFDIYEFSSNIKARDKVSSIKIYRHDTNEYISIADFFLSRIREMEGEKPKEERSCCEKCEDGSATESGYERWCKNDDCKCHASQSKQEVSRCCAKCGYFNNGGVLTRNLEGCSDATCPCHAPQSKEVIPSQEKEEPTCCPLCGLPKMNKVDHVCDKEGVDRLGKEKECGKFDCSLHNDGYGTPCNDGYTICEDNKEPWWSESLATIVFDIDCFGGVSKFIENNLTSLIRSVEKRTREEVVGKIEKLLNQKKGMDYSVKDIEDKLRIFTKTPFSKEAIKAYTRAVSEISSVLGNNKVINELLQALKELNHE